MKGKWLLALRGIPKKKRELWSRHAALYQKAHLARKKGAVGILFVKAGNPMVGSEVIPPHRTIGPKEEILPAITISDDLAQSLLAGSKMGNRSLHEIFTAYYEEREVDGFALLAGAHSVIELADKSIPCRNVLGRLVAGETPSKQAVFIGAHIDHLGHGQLGGSMARGEDASRLHPGADDNASGVAAVMELAQYFSEQKQAGKLDLKRDLVFVAWSGEERGVFGSRHFVTEARKKNNKQLYPAISAYINLDMIGRASSNNHSAVSIHGTDSSYDWREIIGQVEPVEGLDIVQVSNPNKAADSESFYLSGVPTLFPYTEQHGDYHTPGDTVDKIDFEGMTKITRYVKSLVTQVAARPRPPSYAFVPKKPDGREQAKSKLGFRVKERNADGSGISIAEVLPDTPASDANLRKGDALIRIAGRSVPDVDTLVDQLALLSPGTEYPVSIERDGSAVHLKVFLKDRLIPFDHFYVNVETNNWRKQRDIGTSLNVSTTVHRSPGEHGKAGYDVNCFEFDAGQRMLPENELPHFIEAGKHAAQKRSFKEETITTTFRGNLRTIYESAEINDGRWMIRITRGGRSALFEPDEGERLAKAIDESKLAVQWYRKLLQNERIEPGETARPPRASGIYLDSKVGTVMAANGRLGIEVSVRNQLRNQSFGVGYRLRLGNGGSTGGSWVKTLVEEMGTVFVAAEKGEALETKVNDCTITADTRNKTVTLKVVPGRFFRDRSERVSSFTRKDYDRIQSFIRHSEVVKDWFSRNASLFYSETE